MCPSPVQTVALDNCSLTLLGNDLHLCFALGADSYRDTFGLDDRSMRELARIVNGLPGAIVDSKSSPVTVDGALVRTWTHSGFTVNPALQISDVRLAIEGNRIVLAKDGARVFAQIESEPARVMREQLVLEKACAG